MIGGQWRMRKAKKRNNATKRLIVFIFTIFIIAVAYVWLANSVNIDTSTQTIEVGTQSAYNGVTATIFGLDITRFGKTTGEINHNVIGEYQLEYAPYWTTKRYQKIVKVVDKTDPEFIFEGDMEITLMDISEFEEPGYKAIDNYDGDITDRVTTKIEKYQDNYYEVIYQVADSSNNVNIKSRTVHINAGTVYLTFDDGPSLDITPQILDILKENGVTATFFVVGYGESKEDLIRREYEEGHTIGLHGFSHDYGAIYQNIDSIMENFYKVETLVEETTDGYQSKIIRFPGGSSNTVSKNYCKGIMTAATERVTEEGYAYFDWNVDSSDAGGARTAEEVYQNVISGIRPGHNNVVLMHDFSGNTKTLKALQGIIDYCKENNYEFKSITLETTPIQHNVAN